jgi:hypothetical protein
MSFEHRIPKIYYSSIDGTSPERIKIEMETITKRFPGYDIKLSKNIFGNENDWTDHIDSVVDNVDVIIFSHPNECKEFYFNDMYDHEFTLAIKHKKVICIICGKEIKTLSNSNWVNTAMESIKQRR